MFLINRFVWGVMLLSISMVGRAETCQERFDELHDYIKYTKKKVTGTLYVRTGTKWNGAYGVAGRFGSALVLGEAKVKIGNTVRKVTAFTDAEKMRVSVGGAPSIELSPVLCGGTYPVTNFIAPMTLNGQQYALWLKFER